MAETLNKNELYNSTQSNLKKLLEVALSSEIKSGQPLDDPQILQRLQEMTNAINDPLGNCYVVPALYRYCSEGNYEELKNHIINCCDINEIGPDGETALACAINANNFQIVELLLKSGANPNIRPDKIESTPLMDAANAGYVDILRVLLEFGASPDVKSSTNNTALHYAACGGHLECCKIILDYSANRRELIEEQNENGHTGLMEAATSGFFETVTFLVENGAQINTPSVEFKETALTLASYKGYSDIVQFLLEAGADHEHRTDEMHTALMEASMEGHIDAAKVLLYYGAHVIMRADSFESPLTLAACSGHTDLAAYLISYGADIEEVNDESYTPLMEASREGHLETVAMLLSLGANINRVTEETQETAMTLAACGGFYDIVLLLHRCGADIELGASTPLMESAQEGHLDIVKALLVMGAKVDAKNSSDETSLHFASENGHVEVCRYLLEHGADIDHMSEGGRTCLMKACRAGNLEVAFLLIDSGSRVDQLTTMGDHNALSLACANGHCKVVEYLMQIGADPTVKLKDNCTVLIEASRAGHIDVIEILLRGNKHDKRLLVPNMSMGGVGSGSSNITDGGVQHLNNHYLSTTTMNGGHELYDMNKFMNMPLGIRMTQQQQQQAHTHTHTHQPLSGDYAPLPNIYADHQHHHHHHHNNHTQSQYHSCAFSDTETFARPLMLPTEIPDPPTNPPPSPPPPPPPSSSSSSAQPSLLPVTRTHEQVIYSNLPDNASLPLSIFGTDTDKLLLQNMLVEQHNSPNIDDWVKYMCPNFNNNLYVNSTSTTTTDVNYYPTLSHTHCPNQSSLSSLTNTPITVMEPELLQQTAHSHFHRKIKKAKHSENYNTQFDSSTLPSRDCINGCQHRMTNNFFVDKSELMAANGKFHRSPAEGAADYNQQQQQQLLVADDSELDMKHPCKDCNTFHLTNTSKDDMRTAFTYPMKKNLFSSTANSSINKPMNTSLTDSGVFSIDKTTLSTPLSTAGMYTDEYQTDVKRIFNSVTPTTISPLKSQITNQMSSTPFQKQVLQPKRRLQQSQRSPLSNSSSLSLSTSSSLSSDHKIKLTPPSDSFLLLPSSSESSASYTNFNFPEKNLSVEERNLFFQQSMLNDYSRDGHQCSMNGDCTSKHGHLSPNYHLEMMPKINVDNCDNIGARKMGHMISSSNNSMDNLEVVEEIDNEDNDGDFDSDLELDNCAPPYSSHSCCNTQHCKKKLNVNVCTESLQESPLSLACSGGHIEVVKLLINSGAKLEHRDKKSQTALHVAVLNGHLEVVRFLLESGADMEAMVDRTKDTALSIACANGKLEIVEELVHKGANIEHRNISDYTPLSLAASGGYIDIIKFLLKNNAEINSRTNSKLGISPLMLAAMNGYYDAVNVLLDNGSDINAQIETNRNTALTLACYQGRDKVVSLLIERKAYIEHRAKSGLTPLMEAASQGHVTVGHMLIAAGADVNAPPVPTSRETALIIASEKGHTDFVRLLLTHNAIVDCHNKKGDTPLWLASNGGYIDVVKVLIEAMSDTNSADNRRITCLMAAFKKGHVKVVKELVKYVTQFPSEHDCVKHIKSIKNDDKELIKRCEACKEIILKAKERQETEAAKNAKDLLKQVDEEKKAKELKEVKQAKKREKKKAKKKAKHDDKDVEITKNDECVTPIKDEETIAYIIEDLRPSNNNNENINPDNCLTTVKSNKRSRAKQSHTNEETKLEVVRSCSPVVVAVQSVISCSDNGKVATECSDQYNNSKNNSWIQINSNKILYGTKIEENNWQKIGGGKKKLDIQVNKKDIGKVIGQGGSVVNAIRHLTGAHIDIDSMANEMDERTVHLKGTLEAVSKAKDYICDLVEGSITGSTVIKESEPFVAMECNKVVLPLVVAPQAVVVARHNGKLIKAGHTRIAPASASLTTTTTTTNSGNNLQYGFSKSTKNPDFASVTAAGIVNVVSSPVKIKSTEKLIGNDSNNNSHHHHFPSLSESTGPLAPAAVPLSLVTASSTTEVPPPPVNSLEINTNISKSFPLAPGSERSLHQRTYNSTPEHSPQIDANSKIVELASSDNGTIASSNSDKDNNNDPIDISNYSGPPLSYHHHHPPPPVNWANNIDYNRSYQEPINFDRFPKLQSLNPKAEAFLPANNSSFSNFPMDEYCYNVNNGTLTLNPTANIFHPRQCGIYSHSKKCTGNNVMAPVSITSPVAAAATTASQIQQTQMLAQQPQAPPQPQEEQRLIRLQDHINMAINILLRNNGFDHNLAEAAFTSFMRSANLDLNTRLTTTEFTSLINNIINQSNTVASPAPPPPPPVLSSNHQTPSLGGFLTHIPQSSVLSTPNNHIHQPLLMTTTPHTGWPMMNSLNSQSIWASGVSNGVINHHHHTQQQQHQPPAIHSPFFPNLSQCVSAQAAFNSPILTSYNNNTNNGAGSIAPDHLSASSPSLLDITGLSNGNLSIVQDYNCFEPHDS